MKKLKVSDFPELQRVFSGYLHQDFLEEYGTPAAALQAFLEDANVAENRRFRTEARRFLDRIDGLELSEVREFLTTLGSCWVPPSRKALTTLMSNVGSSRA